jgi:cytochrome c nitrite reductase small subunit
VSGHGRLRRPHRFAILAAAALGAAVGLGAFTFIYAKGASYLTTDPAACANCHIMGEHFAAWQRSSHRAVATCADCHMPHNVIGKYAAKASNGFWHSVAFTTGRHPDPLLIKPRNRAIVEQACRDCHEPIVGAIEMGDAAGRARVPADARPPVSRPQVHDGIGTGTARLSCVRCHVHVGHWIR